MADGPVAVMTVVTWHHLPHDLGVSSPVPKTREQLEAEIREALTMRHQDSPCPDDAPPGPAARCTARSDEGAAGSSDSPSAQGGRRPLALAIAGKLRRAWSSAFGRRYIVEQHSRRRGGCQRCGSCCRLVFRCPFLTRQNECSIYGLVRPPSCVDFPIDARDVQDAGGRCGFSLPSDTQEVRSE